MLHPALQTSICASLGIDYPVLQAGMGFVARGELAAAVSKAGGLGTLGAATISASDLREEIALIQRTTDKLSLIHI